MPRNIFYQYTGQGNPVDVRDLFDKEFLEEIIRGIFGSYYRGFVGKEFTGALPVDFDKLSARMKNLGIAFGRRSKS